MQEISLDVGTFGAVAEVVQLGPREDDEALELSSMVNMVAFGPQTAQVGCFGGFLIRKKEH